MMSINALKLTAAAWSFSARVQVIEGGRSSLALATMKPWGSQATFCVFSFGGGDGYDQRDRVRV
jgi:hypothetical protein